MGQVNVRLSDAAIVELDKLVEKGIFKDRATAIRAALKMLLRTEEQRAQGRRIVALDDKTIRELNLALELA